MVKVARRKEGHLCKGQSDSVKEMSKNISSGRSLSKKNKQTLTKITSKLKLPK